MTIRHLTIFVAVADHGSMSAAASYLYLSQPTISQAIRELEKHYNGLLFERLGRKLYLTERGRLLLPQARNLIRQFQQIEELMLNQGQSSTLKLGSTITVGTCLTPFLIPKLQKLCPEVRVHSYVSNTKDIEQKLLRSELDVGIVEGEVLSSDLSVLPIIDDCLVLAVGKDQSFLSEKLYSRCRILPKNPLPCVSREAELDSSLRNISPDIRFLSRQSGNPTVPVHFLMQCFMTRFFLSCLFDL